MSTPSSTAPTGHFPSSKVINKTASTKGQQVHATLPSAVGSMPAAFNTNASIPGARSLPLKRNRDGTVELSGLDRKNKNKGIQRQTYIWFSLLDMVNVKAGNYDTLSVSQLHALVQHRGLSPSWSTMPDLMARLRGGDDLDGGTHDIYFAPNGWTWGMPPRRLKKNPTIQESETTLQDEEVAAGALTTSRNTQAKHSLKRKQPHDEDDYNEPLTAKEPRTGGILSESTPHPSITNMPILATTHDAYDTEAEEQKEWDFACEVCCTEGNNYWDEEEWMICESCRVWQHCACHSISRDEYEREELVFLCTLCRVGHVPPLSLSHEDAYMEDGSLRTDWCYQ